MTKLKVLMAQCNFTIGDLEGNFNKIKEVLSKNHKKCDIAVFSELALSGYPPLDLIENPVFMRKQEEYFEKLVSYTEKINCAVVVGFIDKNTGRGKKFFNTLAFINEGEILYKYNKQLLPTYNIFDEDRHFESGTSNEIIEFKGERLAFLICEDLWYKEAHENDSVYQNNPLADLVLEDVDLLITINASPSEVDKVQKRHELINKAYQALHVPIVYVNQVGANDDVVFDGNSFVYEYNGISCQCLPFQEDIQIYDGGDEPNKRIRMPKLESKLIPSKIEVKLGRVYVDGKEVTESYEINSVSNVKLFYNHIKLGIRDYVKKTGFKKVVIGSSGGIDSAVVMAMAVEALGAENVEAITMPTQFSSEGSWGDSEDLCKNLGIKLYHRSIQKDFEVSCEEFKNSFGEEPSKLTKENMQARIRGRVLMEFSNHFGHLVLSTGNKTEMGVGYCTLYGDTNGGISPLSDLYKMEVYALAKYINKKHGRTIVPINIIEKEPSAELSEDQKDSDNLPEYPTLDAIVRMAIEGDLLGYIDRKLDLERFVEGSSEFNKVMKLIRIAEYKRRQAPPTIRCHKRAWGSGRRYPIAAKY